MLWTADLEPLATKEKAVGPRDRNCITWPEKPSSPDFEHSNTPSGVQERASGEGVTDCGDGLLGEV